MSGQQAALAQFITRTQPIQLTQEVTLNNLKKQPEPVSTPTFSQSQSNERNEQCLLCCASAMNFTTSQRFNSKQMWCDYTVCTDTAMQHTESMSGCQLCSNHKQWDIKRTLLKSREREGVKIFPSSPGKAKHLVTWNGSIWPLECFHCCYGWCNGRPLFFLGAQQRTGGNVKRMFVCV